MSEGHAGDRLGLNLREGVAFANGDLCLGAVGGPLEDAHDLGGVCRADDQALDHM